MRTLKSLLVGAIGLGCVGLFAAPAAAIGPAAIAGATVGGLLLLNAGQNGHHGGQFGGHNSHSQFPTLGQSIHGGHPGSFGHQGVHPGAHGGHPGGHHGGPGFRTDFFTGAPAIGPSGGHGRHPGFGGHNGSNHGPGFGPGYGQYGQGFNRGGGYGGNCRTVTDTILDPAGRPSLVRYATCMDGFGRAQFVPGSLIVHQTF